MRSHSSFPKQSDPPPPPPNNQFLNRTDFPAPHPPPGNLSQFNHPIPPPPKNNNVRYPVLNSSIPISTLRSNPSNNGLPSQPVAHRIHHSNSAANLNAPRLNANLDASLPRPNIYQNANPSVQSMQNVRKTPSISSLDLNRVRPQTPLAGSQSQRLGLGTGASRGSTSLESTSQEVPQPTHISTRPAHTYDPQLFTMQAETPPLRPNVNHNMTHHHNVNTQPNADNHYTQVPLPVRSQIQTSILNSTAQTVGMGGAGYGSGIGPNYGPNYGSNYGAGAGNGAGNGAGGYNSVNTYIGPQSKPAPRKLCPPDRMSGAALSVSSSRTSAASTDTFSDNKRACSQQTLTIEHFEEIRRRAAHQTHDPKVQLEFAKSLCQAANQLAIWYEDPVTVATGEVDPHTRAKNCEVWVSQALKIIRKLISKTQFPDAMFYLGTLYSSGSCGLEADHIKAFELYEKASRLDHDEACYRVAVCCEFGIGTPGDIEKAVIWYRKAAVLGSVASMYKLGILSLMGSLNQPRDFKVGFAWLQRAASKADRKNPHALHEIGLLYEHSPVGTFAPGDPIPKNDMKAFENFSAAARLGYAPSQARIGRCYEFGELGTDIMPEKSFSWYTEAANQGDADAQLGLAGWYWTGFPNLKKNETEAFMWAERSAMKEHPRAQFAVGYFYEHGIGVHRDLEQARVWYARAAHKKHPRAEQKLKDPLFS